MKYLTKFIIILLTCTSLTVKSSDLIDVEKVILDMQDSFEKMFNEMDKDFSKNIDRIFKGINPFPNAKEFHQSVEHFWKEDKRHHILIIKMEDIDSAPLDIKINSNGVTIEGKIEKITKKQGASGSSYSSRSYSFHKGPIPLPAGAKYEEAKIEKKKERVIIKFPKTVNSQKQQRKKRLIPIPNRDGDLTL